jgi:Tfp pilus assembly protein PilX
VRGSRGERGSILLEVLLAIGVFAFAGVVVLSVVDEALASGARDARRAVAMDLARSALASMEAGLDAGAAASADASLGAGAGNAAAAGDPRAGLRVETALEPSDYPGLSLAVVQVFDEAARPSATAQLLGGGGAGGGGAGGGSSGPPRLAVLRQLVRTDGGEGTRAPEAPRPELSR